MLCSFIPDKSVVTVVEAFLINWIRIFGRPSMVHFDRGNELINPILGGGGQIYLKCPLSHKISRIDARSRGHGVSKFKLGHM